ncbi:MAG TPA: hypothetical protein VFP71_02840 [Candidatus Angelobacter sp.]|nr:hypothetical protein [Candidatus Angelobacter sp.]
MPLRSLVLPFVFGCLVLQGSFPHPIGKPNVKIEYLGKARVSAQEKGAIIALVFAGNSVQSCTGFNRNAKEEIESIRIARANLKQGEHNLLVQASDNCNCGGTGNCSFWILRERSDGFDALLKTFMVQSFAVEPSSSNGYKDVITYAHGSASYGELALYQFDGKQYHKTRCASEEYKLRDNDTFEEKPTITSTDCEPEK